MITAADVQRLHAVRLALCCALVIAGLPGAPQGFVQGSAEHVRTGLNPRSDIPWGHQGQDGGDKSRKGAGLAGATLMQHRRLVDSKRRRRGGTTEEKWIKMHELLAREVSAADEEKGYDVLFYGDSIFEATRGTYLGATWSEFRQVKEVWEEVFAGKTYTTHTLAISGDTVKKLLWRMKNGEVPMKREPKVAVVLIGTEDLVSPVCADPITAPRTAAELRGLLVYMHRRMPAAQIVAMGVLPKGQTWPNRCTDAITQANQRLQEYAERHQPWLTYIDMGDRFLTHQDDGQGHQEIVPSLLTQDTLNPSHYGIRIIATELEAILDKLTAQGICIADQSQGLLQRQGSLRKAIAHIKPRSNAERAAAKVVAQKERAARNKRRREEVSKDSDRDT